MISPLLHLEDSALAPVSTSPPTTPLKGGVVKWGKTGGDFGPKVSTRLHLSPPLRAQVETGGFQPFFNWTRWHRFHDAASRRFDHDRDVLGLSNARRWQRYEAAMMRCRLFLEAAQ